MIYDANKGDASTQGTINNYQAGVQVWCIIDSEITDWAIVGLP